MASVLPVEDRSLVLDIARDAIAESLGEPLGAVARHEHDAPWLRQTGASFVTLRARGELRGCIGTVDAYQPLIHDVRDNARGAAFRDPRFEPLALSEWEYVRVEVSLLSPPRPLVFDDEADALSQLRPFVDGVVFEFRDQRATFLPQVWEALPHAHEFMAQLKRKAGLPRDFWHADVRVSRYTVDKFVE